MGMAAAVPALRCLQLLRSAPSVAASALLGQGRHLKAIPGPLPPVTDQDVEELNNEINGFFGEFQPDNCAESYEVPHDGPGSLEASSSTLSHVDAEGKASMVDVGTKSSSTRVATASGLVVLGEEAFYQVKTNQMKKGDVLSVSQLAGIMGAKATSQLIPLCHNIFISSVNVHLELDESRLAVRIRSTAKTVGQTGVEMEALTATSVAALTVYDMCKAVSKDIVIQDIMLDHKSGGKSGNFTRESQ